MTGTVSSPAEQRWEAAPKEDANGAAASPELLGTSLDYLPLWRLWQRVCKRSPKAKLPNRPAGNSNSAAHEPPGKGLGPTAFMSPKAS